MFNFLDAFTHNVMVCADFNFDETAEWSYIFEVCISFVSQNSQETEFVVASIGANHCLMTERR